MDDGVENSLAERAERILRTIFSLNLSGSELSGNLYVSFNESKDIAIQRQRISFEDTIIYEVAAFVRFE